MGQVLKIVGLASILIGFILKPVLAQSLFESSQSESREELVSNNFTLGGFFQSASYLSQDPLSQNAKVQSAYAQLGLGLDVQLNDWAGARGEVRLRYGSEFDLDIAEVEIREAYVKLNPGVISFRLGKLIAPWGKASVLNPTDRLSPTDPLVRSPETDDRKEGIWGLEGGLQLGTHLNVSLIWNPLYAPSRLVIDPIPMPDYLLFLEAEYPSLELRESSLGVKLDLRTSPADLSLYGFQGYHTWPGIRYDSFSFSEENLEPEVLRLALKAYRIQMLGVDISLPLGSWVWTSEGAWFRSMEAQKSQEYLPYPELSYASELERSWDHLQLLAGYYGKYILDFRPPELEPGLEADLENFLPIFKPGIFPGAAELDPLLSEQVGAFNRLYNYQLENVYHSLYTNLRLQLFYQTLELSLPLIWHLTTREWILQPSVNYRATDGLSLKLGFEAFYGPEASLLDLVGPTINALFFSLRITF